MAGKIKVPDDCSYRTYSVCESAADSSNRVEEDGEIDGPAVFMCGKCKLPIGDSLSWAGSDDEQNQIMLKRITDNIVIGKEPFVSGTQKELGCYVVGSPGQQMPELDRQDRPVTLEYQNTVEQQMTEADKGGEGESGLGMLTTDMGEACAIAHQP
ncbi:protein Mis18-alpha isoform X3 [Rhinichthys klamathensis goyatoka]|uniref:protein Mis18-alpha isoform X3 n=1 Tax=Rhinichthys klamathensis goyatoka TaxID=3034132 RepID=UPI0024B5862C|nr:protein Mis18-alpha isoform X3 [Rhinichthys klamathensis goyatoka]